MMAASLLAALACSAPAAQTLPSAPASRPASCDGRCVVETFKKLAPIYRPSGEEQEIREKLLQHATEANGRLWNGRLQILGPDRVGNFLIRVPATGGFAGRPVPPVALQAHMDMVLAAAAVGPGGDLRAHFRAHPIQIEEKEGKLRSVGHQTSIGADNTVGCALMLRYTLDPAIEHPPLELVFTVHEEAGLRGAKEYDTTTLPLRAPVMVSLDGFDAGMIAYGSQGSRRHTVGGSLPARPVQAGKLITVTVTRMLGGHSGADIHRQRLNAVIALGRVASAVLADRTLAVVRAVAGDPAGLNKIPTDLELTVSAPASADLAAVRAAAEAAVRQAVAAHPGEAANGDVTVAVAESPLPAEPITALTPAATSRLFEAVLAAETLNGVLTKKTGYPNEVNTSANLGLLEVKYDPSAPARRATAFGFMVRSFSAQELAATASRLEKHLSGVFRAAEVSARQLSGYDPWLEDPGSWLVSLAAGLEVDGARRFSQVNVQAIGVEPSYFSKKFPGISIIGMGATITDAHTVHESVSVQSILDITATLDAFLVRLAGAREFLAAPARRPPG